MKVSKHIDIFLTKKRNVTEINVSQLDTGIQLVFNVKDFNIPSGSSATLYAEKPSGKFVYQTKGITIVKNTITVDLENQAIAEHGKTPYQVSIANGSDVVTSFIGVMNVQRSLKDSGATESKTVMRAFDELTDEKLAEFQARAETIADAVIATIPDDYAELTAKVNESANAIKGKLSGAVVAADDVSPVEHLMNVKVRSKNMFSRMAAGKTATMSGVTFTYNDDGSVKLQGTATGSSNFGVGEVFLDDGVYYLCDFATGDFPDNFQARIQIYSDSTGKSIATLNNFASATCGGGDSFITAGWYQCRIRIDGGYTYDCTLYPTLFKGEQPKEYIPNISDLTVSKVAKFGKNLFKATPTTMNGVTLSKKEDYFVLNGTATASNNFVASIGFLPAGTYTLSANNPSNNNVEWSLIDVYSSEPYSIIAVKDNVNNGKATVSLAENTGYLCRIRIETGKTYNNFVIKPQLEFGSVASEYEAYKERTEHIPTSDGVVNGVTSLSPNMTLLTDTEGVFVECEYNKDTNKVISKLVNAIMAMGGEVTI